MVEAPAQVDGAVAVSDTEVVEAMGLVYERAKLVVEPSAGVGLAAVLNPSFREAVGPDAKRPPTRKLLLLIAGSWRSWCLKLRPGRVQARGL